MAIDPSFRSTHSVTLRGVSPAAGMQPLAYADFDKSGDFTLHEDHPDQTVFIRDADGGGSAIGYQQLREAVEKAGGPIGGKELAQALHADDPKAWVGFSGLPPGVTHPIVDYVYRIGADGELQVDYTLIRSARVITPEDGNIASLDLNGDGKSDPAHDALIQLEQYRDGKVVQGFCTAADLTEAVRRAGGRLDEGDYRTALQHLVSDPFGMATGGPISLSEFGNQVDACSPYVTRSLRLDEQGLVMDFTARP
ncbi:MAG: hypothetical protein HY319_07100 [Armatimonadetes bacterium]|nr:hypothetical protein [Armatimonadota bacterium]